MRQRGLRRRSSDAGSRVDEYVDMAESARRLADHRSDGFIVPRVCDDGHDALARFSAQFIRRCFERIHGTRGDGNVHAFARELASDCLAYSATTTRDDGSLPT
jgi:hypothetical protein